MEPSVTRRDTRLHLSYELPHRIYTSCTYPLIAPNGSTVIVYGHARGFRILWRGGHRRREPHPRQRQAPNGSAQSGAILIDDDGPNADKEQNGQTSSLSEEFEPQEDEQDPDNPYPGIISDVDIDLDLEVLSLAVPESISVHSGLLNLLQDHAVVAASQGDGRMVVFTIPLSPPSSKELHKYIAAVKRGRITLKDRSARLSHLAIKFTSRLDDSSEERQDRTHHHLLVSALSNGLEMWQLEITGDKLVESEPPQTVKVKLPSLGETLSFHPSPRCDWLACNDKFGVVRVYDPFATNGQLQRSPTKNWIMTYSAPFHEPKEGPALTRRKHILAMKWVLGGRGIMVVLEDGEWGVWDLNGQSQSGKTVHQFAIGGFLDPSSHGEVPNIGKQSKGRSKLAPMTPNTRKSKAEDLFAGPPKPRLSSLRGGISVSSNRTRSGHVDESVVLWYGNDIFTITSMQTFWQRSLNPSSGPGSLYAPGLTHLSAINLMQEDITSISQLAAKHSSNALGHMNVVKDLVISTEHRIIISQSARSASRSRNLFEQVDQRPSDSTSQDQRMLDAGELSLGDMDRMLDNMAGDGRARKVGFASG